MNTITLDLHDLKGAGDALATLSGLLAYAPGATATARATDDWIARATDDWIARATASTKLGFPAHFRTVRPPNFTIVLKGVADTSTSMSIVHAVGALVASVNSRSVTLTGKPVITLSLAT